MRDLAVNYASGIIISKDNMILMGEKRPSRLAVYPDAWHLPGGGVDKGETLQEALARELREETGIDIADCEVKLVDDIGRGNTVRNHNGEDVRVDMYFHVFEVKLDKDAADIELHEDDDLMNLCWFTLQELRDVKLATPSVALFTRLGYI